MSQPSDTVTTYYEAVHEHDWKKLRSTLAESVVRSGIMSDHADDTITGRDAYVRFVETVIGSFEQHAMRIERVFYSADRRFACAETRETVREPGGDLIELHCLKWHELDENGRILRIEQFRKGAPGGTPLTLSVGSVLRRD